MPKFFDRVSRVSDALYDWQMHCVENANEFVKCDELAKTLEAVRANLVGAIMDDDAIPLEGGIKVPLPRVASEDMRHGLTVLYPNEERALRVQQTSEKWQEEYPELKVVKADGWDQDAFQYSWFEEEITQVEYFARRNLSTCIQQETQ